MPLTPEQIAYLNVVDNPKTNPMRSDVPDDRIRAQVDRIRRSYQAPDVTLAAMLMEFGANVRSAIERARRGGMTEEAAKLAEYEPAAEDYERSLNVLITEISLVAAGLTRKKRGRPPL